MDAETRSRIAAQMWDQYTQNADLRNVIHVWGYTEQEWRDLISWARDRLRNDDASVLTRIAQALEKIAEEKAQ